MTATDAPSRSPAMPRTIALLGLMAMLVLGGFAIQALTWESGDRVLHLNTISLGVGLVTTAAAVWWTIRARRKGAAITVLVLSVLLSPAWLFLVVLIFG